MFLLEADVPETFRNYVNEELAAESMGNEIDRKWGRTIHGQCVCFITSKVLWFAVRTFVDEEYRNLPIKREFGIEHPRHGVVIKKEFSTSENALNYIRQSLEKYENGVFEMNNIPLRIRILPPEVHQNPDIYLKPGDHIQRNVSCLPYSHEGIYLGNGEVAHITAGPSADSFASSAAAAQAHAKIEPFNIFALSDEKEIRVVVHCFRRRSRTEICEAARRLVAERYGYGQYHVLKQNCQHFASLCVLRFRYMTDHDIICRHTLIVLLSYVALAIL